MSITFAVRRGRARLIVGLALLALGLSLTVTAPASAQGTTIRVPQDHATVQAAVDAAGAGDLILIDKGVYGEEVFIAPEHPGNITIRGVDRDEVIFDGNFELGTAIEAQADNVVMENMSARNYTGNGFYWQSVDGFRGSYLTAYRIGVYAIFSFDAVNGVFEHSYASGSADAAWYVGQCHPCDITMRNVIGEYSALGYSGTNAGGNLVIEDSLFQNNGTGLVPNSLTTEANPPQRELVIRNNVIKDNSNLDTPAKGLTATIVGVGIGIAGGNDNVVEGNTITGHSKYGVAIFPLPEGAAQPDGVVWVPRGNKVVNNLVGDNAEADLTLVGGSGENNCFGGNEPAGDGSVATDPPELSTVWSCDLPGTPPGGSPQSAAILAADYLQYGEFDQRPQTSYEEMPDAPPQEEMPAQQTSEPDAAPDDSGGSSLPATGGGALLSLLGLGLAASGLRLRRRV